MSWMYWTAPTALLFGSVAAALAALTILEVRSPSVPRRGLLGLPTTRGDRFFLGLLAAAAVHLAWVGATDLPAWPALAISVVLMAAIGRYA